MVRRSGRGDVGAARAQLVRLGADGETLEKVEQVRVVNDRVAELIGLDSDAFLRTVVLPQGRFARLLVEDKPAERSRILRQVWRTDELEEMGRVAGEKVGDIRQLRARLEQVGEEHPPDPAGHLEKLEGAAAAASKESDAATATADAAKGARDTLLASERTLSLAMAVAERIRPGEVDRLAGLLAPVEEVMRRIEEEDGRLEQSEGGFRAALAAIPTDDGPAHEDVAAARAGLNDVAALAERAAAAAGTLSDAAEAASESRMRAEAAEAAEARAEKERTQHDAGRPLLTEAADTARRNLEQMERQYRECEDHRRGVVAAREKREAARREHAELAARLEVAQEQEGRTRAAANAAEAVHAEARRANSAAAAAHGLHPGDDCPICRRDLPAAWTAPGDGGLDDAKQAAREAGAQAREAGMRVAGLRAGQQGGEKRLREFGDTVSAARDALRQGLEGLGQGGPGTDDLDAPLPELASLPGPLEAALADATARVEAHDRVRDDLADRAGHAGRAAATAREAARGDSKRAHDTRQAATSALGDLTRKIGSIPAPFRPRLPLPTDPLDLQTMDISPVDAALVAADARHRLLTERDSLRAMLRGQIDHVVKSRADLAQRRTDEVDGPLGSVARELSEQRFQLGGAIRELVCSVEVPAPVPASEPGPLRRWIDGFRSAMTDVLRAADEQCTEASTNADAARTALAGRGKSAPRATEYDLGKVAADCCAGGAGDAFGRFAGPRGPEVAGNARFRAEKGRKSDPEASRSERGRTSALKASRRPVAEPAPHQEPQVEPGRVHQHPLADVLVPAQVRPAHAARGEQVGEGALQLLAPRPQQALAPGAPNPAPVGVGGLPRGPVPLPAPPPAVRLAHVAAKAEAGQVLHRPVRVVAFVAHQLPRLQTQPLQLPASLTHRPRQRGAVATRRRLHRHPAHRPRAHVHRMLQLVAHARPPVLHLRDPRVRIVRVLPVIVGPLPRPLPVQLRQIRTARRLDPRRLGQALQEQLVSLPRVPPHDRPHRRVPLQRRRVDPQRLAAQKPALLQQLQHPGEHRLVRLHRQAPPRPRHRRVVRRVLVQLVAQKLPQRQRLAHRHAIPRSEPIPSRYPTTSIRKYTPGGMLGRPSR